MKSLREFIKDGKDNPILPEVYLDMDGVLADWLKGANNVLEKFGYPDWRDDSWQQLDNEQRDEIRWSILKKQENFWGSLPYMKDGKKLWKFLKDYKPHILSSVEERMKDTAIPEKKLWLEENLGLNNLSNIHLVEHFTKQIYALNEHGQPNILIDDYDLNCEMFENAGGIAIKFENAEQVIKELKKYGFK